MWIPPLLITHQSKLKDWHGTEWLRWQYFTLASYCIYHGTKKEALCQPTEHTWRNKISCNELFSFESFFRLWDVRPSQTQSLHLQGFFRGRASETTGKLFSATQTRLLQFCNIQSLYKVCWARSRHCHSSWEKYKAIKLNAIGSST